jgi:hypothetical protein
MTLTIAPSLPHARGPVTSTVQSAKSMTLTLRYLSHITLHIGDEASILKRFLHGTGHYTPNFSSTNKKLEAAMHAEMHERKIQCPQLERTLHLAANLIEVCSCSRTCNLFSVLELPILT